MHMRFALPAHQKIDVIDNCIVFPADVVIDWNYISLAVRRCVVVVVGQTWISTSRIVLYIAVWSVSRVFDIELIR